MTKTKIRYKKIYCEALKKHLSQGGSYASFSRKIGVNKNTLYNWERYRPEWAEAKTVGKELWSQTLTKMNKQISQMWCCSE